MILCPTQGPSLRVVATMSVGYEHIDVEECKRRHIRVCNTPNVSTDSVAELTVSLLLLTARRLLEGITHACKRTYACTHTDTHCAQSIKF